MRCRRQLLGIHCSALFTAFGVLTCCLSPKARNGYEEELYDP